MKISRELSKAWCLGTAPLRALPDFLIPGAPKCATSSVYDLIALHPEVRRSWRKEPTNFVHYGKSALHARMNHPLRLGRFLCGDASVEYFFHPEAAANAAEEDTAWIEAVAKAAEQFGVSCEETLGGDPRTVTAAVSATQPRPFSHGCWGAGHS